MDEEQERRLIERVARLEQIVTVQTYIIENNVREIAALGGKTEYLREN